jgi:hypothetical protein
MSFFDLRRRGDPLQLQLQLEAPLRTGDELLSRLRWLGLEGFTRCRLTQNRTVMVSFAGTVLRVHRGYLTAPPPVHQAIVDFVTGRTRTIRCMAQRVILSYPVHSREHPPVRRIPRMRSDDAALAQELTVWHQQYNERHFGGALSEVVIRVSGRMRSRLGQYTATTPFGEAAEICVSRSHIRRHGWTEALHTLLHEMVHQWQAENGHAIDHGRIFRTKAVEVGIAPNARRDLNVSLHSISGRVMHQTDLARAGAGQLGVRRDSV